MYFLGTRFEEIPKTPEIRVELSKEQWSHHNMLVIVSTQQIKGGLEQKKKPKILLLVFPGSWKDSRILH
jgi:hypothetical protein